MSGMSPSTLYASFRLKILFYQQVKHLYNSQTSFFIWRKHAITKYDATCTSTTSKVGSLTLHLIRPLAYRDVCLLRLAVPLDWPRSLNEPGMPTLPAHPIRSHIIGLASSHWSFFRICPQVQRSTPKILMYAPYPPCVKVRRLSLYR